MRVARHPKIGTGARPIIAGAGRWASALIAACFLLISAPEIAEAHPQSEGQPSVTAAIRAEAVRDFVATTDNESSPAHQCHCDGNEWPSALVAAPAAGGSKAAVLVTTHATPWRAIPAYGARVPGALPHAPLRPGAGRDIILRTSRLLI